MRVLHVISTLNIGSGISNFVMNYYRKIVDKGIQFDFLAFEKVEKGFEEEVEKSGGKVFYIEKPTLGKIGKYKRAVKDFFKAHCGEWECVHIHEVLVQKYICKPAKKYGSVKKTLIHSHVTRFVLPEYGISPLKNSIKCCIKSIRNSYLFQGIKRNNDFYLACSEDAGKALYGDKILKSEKFFVVKNAIDSDIYAFDEKVRQDYRKEFNIADKKVIALVGRLCEQKNQTFMLDVLDRVCKVDGSFVLLLVGEGRLRSVIEAKVKELGLTDKVIFTGNRTDVQNILQTADLFVLPSIMEGLGIVLVEAQANGLPCIASVGVPECVKVTPHFEFINLSKGADFWADRVLKTQLVRYENSEYLKRSGYDISTSADSLVDIYRL